MTNYQIRKERARKYLQDEAIVLLFEFYDSKDYEYYLTKFYKKLKMYGLYKEFKNDSTLEILKNKIKRIKELERMLKNEIRNK